MKKKDIILLAAFVLLFLPFFISKDLFNFYNVITQEYPLLSSFLKFSVLATAGESIGLRIKKGVYNYKGFGLLPRAIVWGFIGVTVKLAMTIFYWGTPAFLEKVVGFDSAIEYLGNNFTFEKLLVAFCISAAMNIIYAPVMMTFHKITDTHILNQGGSVKGLFSPISISKILQNLNWDVQYNFVIKKTIPIFWIPAHTITFLLPINFQVLFAAILSVMLGIILAVSSQKSNKSNNSEYHKI